jgi:hypothetical protein
MPSFLSGFDPRLTYGIAVACGIIVWLANTAAERHRREALKDRIGHSLLPRLGAEPLPASISVLARLGERAVPQQSLDVIVMRPTFGLKGVSLVISTLALWITWGGKFDEMVPDGAPFRLVMSAVVAFCVLNTFLFEARVDRSSLIVIKFTLWRSEYLWRDLTAIKDDGSYLYFLHFAKGGKVNIPKHLVGMPGFLKFLGEIMEQNETTNARATRS